MMIKKHFSRKTRAKFMCAIWLMDGKRLLDNLRHFQSFNAHHKLLISREMDLRGTIMASSCQKAPWNSRRLYRYPCACIQGVPDFFMEDSFMAFYLM